LRDCLLYDRWTDRMILMVNPGKVCDKQYQECQKNRENSAWPKYTHTADRVKSIALNNAKFRSRSLSELGLGVGLRSLRNTAAAAGSRPADTTRTRSARGSRRAQSLWENTPRAVGPPHCSARPVTTDRSSNSGREGSRDP